MRDCRALTQARACGESDAREIELQLLALPPSLLHYFLSQSSLHSHRCGLRASASQATSRELTSSPSSSPTSCSSLACRTLKQLSAPRYTGAFRLVLPAQEEGPLAPSPLRPRDQHQEAPKRHGRRSRARRQGLYRRRLPRRGAAVEHCQRRMGGDVRPSPRLARADLLSSSRLADLLLARPPAGTRARATAAPSRSRPRATRSHPSAATARRARSSTAPSLSAPSCTRMTASSSPRTSSST